MTTTSSKGEGRDAQWAGNPFGISPAQPEAKAEVSAPRKQWPSWNLVNEMEREIGRLNDDLCKWQRHFDMYRGAWLREIGGVIRTKAHEIDGFVLRTRDVIREAEERAQAAANASQVPVQGSGHGDVERPETGSREASPKSAELETFLRETYERLKAHFEGSGEAALELERLRGRLEEHELQCCSEEILGCPQWHILTAAIAQAAGCRIEPNPSVGGCEGQGDALRQKVLDEVADYILSFREGGNMEHTVQVFDVLAANIRTGASLAAPSTPGVAPPKDSPMTLLVNALNDPRWNDESTALAREIADRARADVERYLSKPQAPGVAQEAEGGK